MIKIERINKKAVPAAFFLFGTSLRHIFYIWNRHCSSQPSGNLDLSIASAWFACSCSRLHNSLFISMFLPHARSVKKRAVRKSSSGTCATAVMSSSRSVIPANDLKSSKVNILFLLLCDRSIIKPVCEESNKQKNHSEKGVKNFFEKNRKKWPRLSVWRVDITEEMA